MIELIVKKDDREINRYFLPQGVTTLGRAEDNTIILDDSCVSRKHARIKVEGGRVSIEDLGSGNGTFHGEQRIEREDLADGDEIVIEPFHLLLRKDNQQKVIDSTRPVPSAGGGARSERLGDIERPRRQPGGSAAGGPRLEVIRGEGGPFLLSEEPSSIGRSDEAKITLKDPSSSRKHAEISRAKRGWVLKDLGSANGTYCNGAAVQDIVLADGDMILIGNTELRFVDPSAQEDVQLPVTPPPRTAPVQREARRPPPRRPEPEPEPAQMDYDGGMSGTGGSLPMDMPSSTGTDVGGMPPPAWGNGNMDATGEGEAVQFDPADDLNGDFADNNGEEFGMELGEDALFPGGERPPDSLIGKFIFSLKNNRTTRWVTILGLGGFVTLLIVANKNQDANAGRPTWVGNLDRKQEYTLQTMEQEKKDARAIVEGIQGGGDRKDYRTALEKFGHIYTFGNAQEMTKVRQAQSMKLEALDHFYTIHEALVMDVLKSATAGQEKLSAELKSRFDRDLAQCRTQLDLGKKRGKGGAAVAAYNASIVACRDLLTISPSNAEAKTDLQQASIERTKLVGEESAEQLAQLKERCQKQMDIAASKYNQRTFKGYQDSIKDYEQVMKIDITAETSYPAAANGQIASAKRKLVELAKPYREQAKALGDKQSWREARKNIRQAIQINPYDATLDTQYDQIEEECLKNAAKQLQEAKVYESAENYAQARSAIELALSYADQPTDKEYRQAFELKKKIQRATEVSPGR